MAGDRAAPASAEAALPQGEVSRAGYVTAPPGNTRPTLGGSVAVAERARGGRGGPYPST